jgi:hypothetical protein
VESLAEIEKQKGMDMQMKEAPRCAGHVLKFAKSFAAILGEPVLGPN